MAVAGRKFGDFLCFLCKDHGKSKQSDGFCIQCSDYLCKTCFENHKRWRVSKDHTFGSETETTPEVEQAGFLDYDKCSKHVNESIKFYCKAHDQVGCGDCMIVDHKPCTVEYVCEKADVFMDSQEYSCFVKRISKCQERASQLKASIEKSKKEVTVENDMFVKDVQNFKDEIIAGVKQLADTAIQEANKIKMRDTQNMHALGIQRENAGTDSNAMYNAVEILTDQPNKLFVTAIQQKPILNEIEHSLDDIELRWKIEHYYFQREAKLERVLKNSPVLGTLQRKENSDTGKVALSSTISTVCSITSGNKVKPSVEDQSDQTSRNIEKPSVEDQSDKTSGHKVKPSVEDQSDQISWYKEKPSVEDQSDKNKKHKSDTHNGNVACSLDDFDYWRSRLEKFRMLPVPGHVFKERNVWPVNRRKTNSTKGTLYITNPCVSVASTNFVDLFRADMKDIGIPLQNISVDNITHLDEHENLIVVCNNVSRILLDFESCLKCVKSDQYLHSVVIVLHVGRKAPVSTCTKEVLLKSGGDGQFKNVHEIINMMYDRRCGIYFCDLNTGAYKRLKYLYQ